MVEILFITDKLIYLQLQKTGCTHISLLFSKCVGGSQKTKHQYLKNYSVDKFIVGSIRNPWNWYVSLWAFGCAGKGSLNYTLTRRDLFDILNGFITGKIDKIKNELEKPVKIWKNTYRDYKNPENFRKWLKLMHDPIRKKDINEGYPEHSISNFTGIMTYRYCRLYHRDFFLKKNQVSLKNYGDLIEFDKTHNLLDFIIRNESLEDDVVDVLKKVGYNLDENKIKLIYENSKKKTHKSKHYDSCFYYNKETVDLIAKSEKFIIEKYGYKPPSID